MDTVPVNYKYAIIQLIQFAVGDKRGLQFYWFKIRGLYLKYEMFQEVVCLPS